MMQRDMRYNYIIDLNGVYITLNLVVLDSLPFFFFLNLHYQRQMVQEILVNTSKKTVFDVTHNPTVLSTKASGDYTGKIDSFILNYKEKTKHNGKDKTKTTPLGVRLFLFVT